jgi:hypothetical protein
MPVPLEPVPMSSIQSEFGGSSPISLSEYYRSGGLVPSDIAVSPVTGEVQIPTSGSIRIGMFRGLPLTASPIAPSQSDRWYVEDYIGIFEGTAVRTASITFNTNGTVTGSGSSSVTPNWYTPTTTNIGSSYWIRASGILEVETNNFGTHSTSGTTDTWLQLSSARSWSVTVDGFGIFANWSLQFEISDTSNGSNILATYTLNNLLANVANIN